MTSWTRQKECKRLWTLLARGENISLFGVRRVGKTHLMQLLHDQSRDHNFHSVFINLEAATTPQEATKKIAEDIQFSSRDGVWQQIKARLGDVFQGDSEADSISKALLKTDWSRLLHTMLESLDSADNPTLLLVDEITVCVSSCLDRDKNSGTQLLRSIRELQQRYKNVRWLVTGSLGIDNIAERYKLGGAFNTLTPYQLDPLNAEQARDFVVSLCADFEIQPPDEATHRHMQSRLGWLSAHYLKRLTLQVEELLLDSAAKFDSETVDAACEQLLGHPHNRLFSDWPDHINRNYPEHSQRPAHAILKLICKSPEGHSRATIDLQLVDIDPEVMNTTLNMLCTDGYLSNVDEAENYRFAFALLREYWAKVLAP